MTVTHPHPLATISPTEAVLLYGDRVVTSHRSGRFDREQVPTSSQSVDGRDLVNAAMETLVASVIGAGAVPTVELKPFLKFLTMKCLDLRLAERRVTWPDGSPEARLMDYLARQTDRAWSFEEAIIRLFMPTRAVNAWRLAYQALHDGLVQRGVVARETRKVLLVMTKEQYVLTHGFRAELLRAAPEFERTHLKARETLTDLVREAAGESWHRAQGRQEPDTGSA